MSIGSLPPPNRINVVPASDVAAEIKKEAAPAPLDRLESRPLHTQLKTGVNELAAKALDAGVGIATDNGASEFLSLASQMTEPPSAQTRMAAMFEVDLSAIDARSPLLAEAFTDTQIWALLDASQTLGADAPPEIALHLQLLGGGSQALVPLAPHQAASAAAIAAALRTTLEASAQPRTARNTRKTGRTNRPQASAALLHRRAVRAIRGEREETPEEEQRFVSTTLEQTQNHDTPSAPRVPARSPDQHDHIDSGAGGARGSRDEDDTSITLPPLEARQLEDAVAQSILDAWRNAATDVTESHARAAACTAIADAALAEFSAALAPEILSCLQQAHDADATDSQRQEAAELFVFHVSRQRGLAQLVRRAAHAVSDLRAHSGTAAP